MRPHRPPEIYAETGVAKEMFPEHRSRYSEGPFKQQWCNKLLLRKAQFSAGSVDCIAIPAVEINQTRGLQRFVGMPAG